MASLPPPSAGPVPYTWDWSLPGSRVDTALHLLDWARSQSTCNNKQPCVLEMQAFKLQTGLMKGEQYYCAHRDEEVK